MTVQPDEAAPCVAVVTTTVGGEADAERLAGMVVARRLAACVQACRIVSTYRWDGRVQREAEWRLDLKTTQARADALMAALAEAHPYDEPELVVTEVGTSVGYAAWVAAETVSGG